MTEPLPIDVVVIGGGLAGMVAADRVAQLGRSVAVLEKGAEQFYSCNSRFAFGAFHICRRDMMSDPAFLLKEIQTSTAGFARPDLAEAVAKDGSRIIRWLLDEGAKLIKANPATAQNWMAAPPSNRSNPGLDWKGRGPDMLLQLLEANLAKRGGRVQRGTRVRSLIMEGGRCVGVEAETADGAAQFRAKAVAIADGGFQANPELVRANISSHPERIRLRASPSGVGDGVLMATAAGAATVGMNRFYGHVLSADALTNDKLWPVPYADELVTAGIVVDSSGRRFTDEGRGGEYVANAIAGLDDPLSALLIFDQAIWDGPGRSRVCPPNPNLKEAGATIHQADDLDRLAALAQRPAAMVSQTVAEYNAAVDSGRTESLTPPRRTDWRKPMAIRTPPFYGVPLCAGMTHTMGGIAIDAHGRVLDAAGNIIAGLFAAGASTGGLEGGPEVGYVGGLSKASITGLRAAERIAEELKQ